MNKKLNSNSDGGWYLSSEILYFEFDDPSEQEDYQVWENLILIKGKNRDEAYRKAVRHGKLSEQKVEINGKPGRCRFKGLKQLGEIYEEIEDGCELEWREYSVSPKELKTLITPKSKLHAFQINIK